MTFDEYEQAITDPWTPRYEQVPCIWCGRPMTDREPTAPYCSTECAIAAEIDNGELREEM